MVFDDEFRVVRFFWLGRCAAGEKKTADKSLFLRIGAYAHDGYSFGKYAFAVPVNGHKARVQHEFIKMLAIEQQLVADGIKPLMLNPRNAEIERIILACKLRNKEYCAFALAYEMKPPASGSGNEFQIGDGERERAEQRSGIIAAPDAYFGYFLLYSGRKAHAVKIKSFFRLDFCRSVHEYRPLR